MSDVESKPCDGDGLPTVSYVEIIDKSTAPGENGCPHMSLVNNSLGGCGSGELSWSTTDSFNDVVASVTPFRCVD